MYCTLLKMKGLIRAFRVLLHVPIENLFFVLFFWLLNGFIDVTASEMTGNRLRERGGTRSKGPQTRTRTQGPTQGGSTSNSFIFRGSHLQPIQVF